jgi:hypothetical protein
MDPDAPWQGSQAAAPGKAVRVNMTPLRARVGAIPLAGN